MSVCTDYCKGCFYRKYFTARAWPYCDYLCMTGKRRPCPAGDGCTEKVTADPYKPKAFTVVKRPRVKTPEQKEKEKQFRLEKRREQDRKRYLERTEEDKEKDREKCREYYHSHKAECNAKHAEYYRKNRERINAQNRERRRRQREAQR